MKKTRFKQFITACLALVIIASVGAVTVHATTDLENSIQSQEKVITVGYTPNYGIIDEPFVRGSEGYGYEYLDEIERHSDYRFEYIPMQWADGLEKLKEGEIDLLGSASMTEERKEIYEYVETPFSFEVVNIYGLPSSDFRYNDPQSLNGLTFGTLEGSVFEDYFAEYAEKNQIDYTIKYTDYRDVHADIESGKIDLYLGSSVYFHKDMEVVAQLGMEKLYFITQKGNTALAKGLDDAMAEVEYYDATFNELLWNKYYGTVHFADAQLTEEEVSALKQKEVYTVGYHSDWRPQSYEEKGVPKGYAIDIMDSLAEKLDIKVEYVPLHNGANNDPSELDFNLCTANDECAYYGQFSEPYGYFDMVALTDQNLKNHKNAKSIVAMDYSTVKKPGFFTAYENARIYFAYSGAEFNALVEECDADCVIALEPRSQMLMNMNPNQNMAINYVAMGIPQGITISDALPQDVYNAVNKTIASFGPSLVEDMIAQNINYFTEKESTSVFLEEYKFVIINSLALLLFFVLIVYLRITTQHKKNLKKIAEIDALTGLMTVNKLYAEAKKQFETAKPNEYVLLSFDIDNFKTVNQTYGTLKGDEVLCAVADRLKQFVEKDTLVGHYYGDIFVVLTKAEKIGELTMDNPLFAQEYFDEIARNAGISIPLHFSTGAYFIDDVSVELRYINDCVKIAREISKKTHGNSITVYTKELEAQVKKEMIIYSSMEQAIRDKEFFIVVQPKIQLETGKLAGGEVLVRWKKPDGTFVYPDEFIPLFEKNGFITKLDAYVFEEACRFVKNATIDLPHLSVNVSLVTALHENFVESYVEILERYDLMPQQFELELTESALDIEGNTIIDIVEKLRLLGFSLSIDDFGKGASSLSRVKELDVDVIKLDKGFITNNFNVEKGNTIIANAIALASSLGITTLAEGIETKEQLETLLDLGCDLGQGYYFDKPLSVEEFLSRVEDDSKIVYPPVMKSKEKMTKYLSNFEHLPYGFAIAKNDPYSTIIQANKQFYKIIGHTEQEMCEKHENRLTDILIDNLYHIVKEQAVGIDDCDFVWDLRIRKADGSIVWVADYAHYDAKENVFFVTFINTTDKMIGTHTMLSTRAYEAQKEALLYMNDLTSDFVSVSDVETDEIIFANENAMKLVGFTCEDDWIGKEHSVVFIGNETIADETYNKAVLQKGAGGREYFSKQFGLYLRNESKIIEVMGRKMRLNVVSDITSKVNLENENKLQLALKDCIAGLYTTMATDATFNDVLERLRVYYDADRAYYFTLSKKRNVAVNLYEVVRDGVAGQIQDLQAVPFEVFEPVHKRFDHDNAWYMTTEEMALDSAYIEMLKICKDGNITSVIFCPIQDENGNYVGLMGLDNPTEKGSSVKLMTLFSKYVGMFIKNLQTKTMEQEILQSEEFSKEDLLKKSAGLLNDFENADEKITEVLDLLHLLRKHYGASAVNYLQIDKGRETYGIAYESVSEGVLSRIQTAQRQPVTSLDKWMEPFSTGNTFVYGSIDQMPLDAPERKAWERFGITDIVVAPIRNRNGEIYAFVSVNNTTLTMRSKTMVGVIAKDIEDYLEKNSMMQYHEKEVALDSMTQLTNKIATQNTIESMLREEKTGVLCIIDIDDFKNVNDTLGHVVGDQVIMEIANELKKIFRDTDVVGRIGGDEFMVFCPNPITDDVMMRRAKSICKNCNKTYEKDDVTVETSISVGILRINEIGTTFTEAYEKVDKALYAAKENGRNQYCFCE